ncbi:MAG: amidohydrolase family protein [Planctomycetes bacterium]|nr:amidohydrolase family protein [Planctomycetota bacterium]
MHELVIRGGVVVDGSGGPARVADVALSGRTITAVGDDVGRGHRELDAEGLLVCPGFVDIHTHYDAQATWDPQLTPSGWHGCTTVVQGSCGVGFAPAAPDRHGWLIRLMEGVEDIPGSALSEGIRWGWETFPEYLDALAAFPRALDLGAQVPHGALRAYVMGERGAANEAATPADIERMSRLVEEALRAGALGFSTSRTLLHKSIDGDPVPGTFATREELFGIGAALARAGHGVFQLATDHVRVPEELDWVDELAREVGCKVMFNLSQIDQAPELWRQVAQKLAGMDPRVQAQVAGRAIGILMTLDGTAHPFVPYAGYQAIAQLPLAERVAKLRDPAFRASLLSAGPLSLGPFEDFIAQTYGRMFLPNPDGTIDYEPTPQQSVAAVAASRGLPPAEVALDALLADEGRGFLYFPLFNYAGGDLEPLYELHQSPRTLMGLSDAGAHCGAICDGGMPTFMLTHWARDRARGATLPLEHVIQRQTRATAEAFGLRDRGLLAPGYLADLNLIDLAALRLEAPRLVYDLPAGGRRLVQRARGYAATIKSGVITRQHDEATGELPGQLVRGPQRAASLV